MMERIMKKVAKESRARWKPVHRFILCSLLNSPSEVVVVRCRNIALEWSSFLLPEAIPQGKAKQGGTTRKTPRPWDFISRWGVYFY